MPLPPDPDDPRNVVLSVDDAATVAGVTPDVIYAWHSRGLLVALPETEPTGNGPRFTEASVLAAEASTRRRRRAAEIAKAAIRSLTDRPD